MQIELGDGATISCLSSLLQVRGNAPAKPQHGSGDGDVLLFNGRLNGNLIPGMSSNVCCT